jgi:hypothetical protein
MISFEKQWDHLKKKFFAAQMFIGEKPLSLRSKASKMTLPGSAGGEYFPLLPMEMSRVMPSPGIPDSPGCAEVVTAPLKGVSSPIE